MHDIVIRGGAILDGTGAEAFTVARPGGLVRAGR
jgi:N-acyl-D-aspartate/D-glutamate deacylase